MILDENSREKPKIEYPCEWSFKLIGRDKAKLKECIFDIMASRDYKCRDGNISRNGKFVTINATCEVSSEEERNKLFKEFSEHEDVKLVI